MLNDIELEVSRIEENKDGKVSKTVLEAGNEVAKKKRARRTDMGLGKAFEQHIAYAISTVISEDGLIEDLIKEAIANKARIAREIELRVTLPSGESTKLDRQHYLFPVCLASVASGVPLALTGAAGSGKTSMCLSAAKALGLKTYLIPFNPLTSKTDLLGYCDANGKYVESALYLAMKEGAMFVADEFDAADPGVAVILNSIIANGICTFPNHETVTMHKNTRFICCMNTQGTGATVQYVGRNALDAATLDRFAILNVDYDTSLEASFLSVDEEMPIHEVSLGGVPSSVEILYVVRKVRAFCEQQKWLNIVSPRASLLADRLASAGVGRHYITQMVFLRGLTPEQCTYIKKELFDKSMTPSNETERKIYDSVVKALQDKTSGQKAMAMQKFADTLKAFSDTPEMIKLKEQSAPDTNGSGSYDGLEMSQGAI